MAGHLQEPLLATPDLTLSVHVLECSHDCSEFDSDSDICDGKDLGVHRQSRAWNNPTGIAIGKEEKGPPLCFGTQYRGVAVCLFYFAIQTLFTITLAFSIFNERWPISLYLLPSWLGLTIFETWLTFNDRIINAHIVDLRRNGAYLRLVFFVLFVGILFGAGFGYLILRAKRHWTQENARTFIAELSRYSRQHKHCVDQTRLDTLVRFLTLVPLVAWFPCLIATQSVNLSDMEVELFSALVAFSGVDILVAVMDFDYNCSVHVRTKAGMLYEDQEWFWGVGATAWRFQFMHVCCRVAEVVGRVLVFVSVALASKVCPWAAILFVVDFLVVVAILQKVSGPSLKAALLGIPLILIDLSCYIDEAGLAPSARWLSDKYTLLHFFEMLCAVLFYGFAAKGALGIDQSENAWLLTECSGVIMILSYIIIFFLGSRVAPATVNKDAPGSRWCSPNPADDVVSLHDIFGSQVGAGYAPGPGPQRDLANAIFWGTMGEQLQLVREKFAEGSGLNVRLRNLCVLDTLGVGGFGKVLKVQDVSNGVCYALKLQEKGKGGMTCAIREAQALNWTEHPFTVALVHVFHTPELFGLLLEFCADDLNRIILGCLSNSGRPEGLPDERVTRYTACMMLALEHLHEKRIVFRDCKPENVLITSSERGDFAKLTDFGLARSVDQIPVSTDEQIGAMAITRFMSPGVGTPGFMPQEAFENHSFHVEGVEDFHLIAGHDWYSLGCCLLLMMLGVDGGSRVTNSKRDVLLPPPGEHISMVLRKSLRKYRFDADAFHLITALTASDVANRAGSTEMRNCQWLYEVIAALEKVVLLHRREPTT